MKKIFAILMLVFILASCNTPIPTENEEKAEPTYFYFLGKRINAETGNITSLCGDPLCSHTMEECPFYGMDPIKSDWCVIDNHIYFYRQGERIYEDPDYLEKNIPPVYIGTRGVSL